MTVVDYTRPIGAFIGAGLGAWLSMHVMHWGLGLVLGMVAGAVIGDIVGLARGVVRLAAFLWNFNHWKMWWTSYTVITAALTTLFFSWGCMFIATALYMRTPAYFTQGEAWQTVVRDFSVEGMTAGLAIALFMSTVVALFCVLGSLEEESNRGGSQTEGILAGLPRIAVKAAAIYNPVVLPLYLGYHCFVGIPAGIGWVGRFTKAYALFTAQFFAEVNSTAVTAAGFGSLIGGLFGLLLGSWEVGAACGALLCECFYFVHKPVYDWAEMKIEAMDVRVRDYREPVRYSYWPK